MWRAERIAHAGGPVVDLRPTPLSRALYPSPGRGGRMPAAMARKRARPVEQLELKEPPTAPPAGRGPIVLILGPRNWGIAQWINDEGDVPVYRITQRDIRAASTSAVLARKLHEKGR